MPRQDNTTTRKRAKPASRKYEKTTRKPAKAAPAKKTASPKTSSRGKTPARQAPAKAAPRRTPASRSPAASRGIAASPPARKAQPGPARFRGIRQLLKRLKVPSIGKKQASRPVLSGLSLDRKLDITGMVLALTGLLTLLAALSTSNGSLTGGWVSTLAQWFGWGLILFPLGLLAVGLWLVLRNFERVPQVSVERIAGLVLLFLNLMALLHLVAFPTTREESLALAAQGKGGGSLGAALFELLRGSLGLAGAIIALFAWLLIALALALDVQVVDLFRWAPPLLVRLQDWADDLRGRRAESQGQARPQFPITPPARLQSGGPLEVQPGGTGSLPSGLPAGGSPEAAFAAGVQTGSVAPAHVWRLPTVDAILDKGSEVTFDDEYDRQRAAVIEETLASFGAPVNVVEIHRGPTITQFGVEPDFIETRGGRMRVRVGKISSLADDLALALSARRIRVEAPVPGKGFVGIEVPNDEISVVALRDVIESEAFRRLKSPLRFALGQDVSGNAAATDLSVMPHLLIAGQTGSGKSVCVNALISCLLLHNSPDDLRMVMVDPKRVELTGYNGIPHLLAPVVVEMERVVGALQWVLREMDQRYHKLAKAGCRNIGDYNAKAPAGGERRLPHLLVLVDELADLMMLAPDETERAITRLAQLARATGIHLVIATQRPSVDVVTGLIKANFPARIAFAVASSVDSRVILDQPGAERLLGRGDMLFQAPDAPAPLRLQGCFVSDAEIQRLVSFWQAQAGLGPTTTAAGGIVDALPAGIPLKQMPLWEELQADENADPLFNDAVTLVRQQGRASISMLQRRLRIGYTRSARLIESLQEKGIIGTEATGSQGFEVLDDGSDAPLEAENP